ncbi:rCG57308 [Rattus norvegicus]|uniref:RCG57308 n=1 Tax=Rattus norvegicus TaxID=10116 RepID=A6JP88_RAT|nr:rCG57308 [Rattus norvegicus]
MKVAVIASCLGSKDEGEKNQTVRVQQCTSPPHPTPLSVTGKTQSLVKVSTLP